MLGIRYHPSSHSSFSPEISGSLSTPQHMNTDWAFFTQPLMRVEWEQNTGSHTVSFFIFCSTFHGRAVGQFNTTRDQSHSIEKKENYSM